MVMVVVVVTTIIQFNSLLFLCRVNSHKANYTQHSNYIEDNTT
jgi:hypothetical protein